MQHAILAIDQGTTNTKALLINRHGHIISQGAAALDITYPKPGWVEQSAQDIWHSVLTAIEQCRAQAPEHNIIAIGISNQRESVIAWDPSTSEPLAPAITWQCRRTTQHTQRLKTEGHEPAVLSKTGLPLDPLFPASKIHWLQNHLPNDRLNVGTVDSWLIWNLTDAKSFKTDLSNASRTQLLDLKSGAWDENLCTLFDVDITALPSVADSSHLFGVTSSVPGLEDNIPIASAIGDSHAALFGHAAFEPGDAKATFGTGSSVMMLTSEFSVPTDGMTTTIAWSIDNKISYALEGNILVSASLFPWVADLLGLDGDVDKLMELANSVDSNNEVVVVPALSGLGAPHWNPQARGSLSGLSFASTRAHTAHAAALSMPLQVVDVFNSMNKQALIQAKHIYVDGGPTKNRFLMQRLADLLDRSVIISDAPELSALGAGMLAGLQTGFWSDIQQIQTLQRDRQQIKPEMPSEERSKILGQWDQAVQTCKYSTTISTRISPS